MTPEHRHHDRAQNEEDDCDVPSGALRNTGAADDADACIAVTSEQDAPERLTFRLAEKGKPRALVGQRQTLPRPILRRGSLRITGAADDVRRRHGVLANLA